MASGPGAAGNGAAVASGEESPLVYKVHLPPKSNPVTQVLHVAKETLFYDDSFRQFKHQSKLNRSILGLKYIFPIFDWGSHYTFKKFIGDFLAGLTIASLAVPQASNQFLISCSLDNFLVPSSASFPYYTRRFSKSCPNCCCCC